MASLASLPHMLMLATSLILIIIDAAMGESTQEKQMCVAQLTGMSTCLPYLGGSSKTTTPECCSGLIQAIKNNKKCICMIVKDRDDPELGLKINITLALGLPSLCKAPDNFSQCPSLLHLDPKSAEAQAFNQLGQNSINGGTISPSTSPLADGSSQHGKNKGTNETATANVNNGASFKGEKVLQSLVAAGLLIWIF